MLAYSPLFRGGAGVSCRRTISFAALLTTLVALVAVPVASAKTVKMVVPAKASPPVTELAPPAPLQADSTAAATPPGCSAAQPEAIIKTHNEAAYIGQSFGREFRITSSFSDYCVRDFAHGNRTRVEVVHLGRDFFGLGNLEHFRMKVYVYQGFVSCGGGSGNYDLGNVDWAYYQANGIIQGGIYGTPCE